MGAKYKVIKGVKIVDGKKVAFAGYVRYKRDAETNIVSDTFDGAIKYKDSGKVSFIHGKDDFFEDIRDVSVVEINSDLKHTRFDMTSGLFIHKKVKGPAMAMKFSGEVKDEVKQKGIEAIISEAEELHRKFVLENSKGLKASAPKNISSDFSHLKTLD